VVARTAEPSILLRSLARTTERLESACQHLSAAQLTTPPAPGGWSLNEILWHIRATADVYGEHIARILNEDQPRWRHVSPRARMKKSRYDRLPFAESFAAFASQRASLIALLESIPAEAWQRSALIRVEDRESQLTLHERVWGFAQHEEIHCIQVEEAAASFGQPE